MFNIGTGEFILIAVLALLILGPTRLPEFARGIGKFIREFRRQTDDVRNVVEREFYRMDEQVRSLVDPQIRPAKDAQPHGQSEHGETEPTPYGPIDHVTDPNHPVAEEQPQAPVTAEMPVAATEPLLTAVDPAAPKKD